MSAGERGGDQQCGGGKNFGPVLDQRANRAAMQG
jgi:hypothetical protein